MDLTIICGLLLTKKLGEKGNSNVNYNERNEQTTGQPKIRQNRL